jgi:pimeloyl-ACP methyl ester carboxylesterase
MRRNLQLPLLAVVDLVVGLLVVIFFPPPPVQTVPPEVRAPDEGSPDIHPFGASIELNHGHVTEEVFLLLHGITNTPVQFRLFGKLLYDRGANVVIPRMRFHGYHDRMTTASRYFTSQVMLDETSRAIDHTRTLGRRVTVIGLSVNGISAAWVAQNRSDVDTAMLMAPLLAARGMPNWTIRPSSRLFSLLPNFSWMVGFRGEAKLGKGFPDVSAFFHSFHGEHASTRSDCFC